MTRLLTLVLACVICFQSYSQSTYLTDLPSGPNYGNDEALVSQWQDGDQVTIRFSMAANESWDDGYYDHLGALAIYADIQNLDGSYDRTEHLFVLTHDWLQQHDSHTHFTPSAHYDGGSPIQVEIEGSANEPGWQFEQMTYYQKNDRAAGISMSHTNQIPGHINVRHFMDVTFDLSNPVFDSWKNKQILFKVGGFLQDRGPGGSSEDAINVTPASPITKFADASYDLIDLGFIAPGINDSKGQMKIEFNQEKLINGQPGHIGYMWIDYSLDGGPYQNMGLFRHDNIIPDQVPFGGNGWTFHGSQGTYRYFVSTDDMTYLEDRSLVIDNTYDKRFQITVNMRDIPRFANASNVRFRINSSYRVDSSTGESSDLSANGIESELIGLHEENDTAGDELGFSASLNSDDGFVEISFRAEKRSLEYAYDHLSCITLEANNLTKERAKILSRVGHTVLSCDHLSGYDEKNFSGISGDTYKASIQDATKLILVDDGLQYDVDNDGYVKFRYYFDSDEFGDLIKYTAYGQYRVYDFYLQSGDLSAVWSQNHTDIRGNSVFTIPDVTGFVVTPSPTLCEIDLAWDAPGAYGNAANNRVGVYRNGILIADLDPQVTTSFKDTNIEAGANYDYQVVARYSRDHNGSLEGAFTAAQSAMIAVPDAPFGLTLTQGACAADITVDWGWTGDDPDFFQLERKTSNTGFEVVSNTIPGGQRQLIDNNGIVSGELYSYRVAAIGGNCSALGKYSDIVTLTGDTVDITLTINEGGLETSKGYFDNRTELFWSTSGQNDQYLHRFKIYAREVGSLAKPTLLQTVNESIRTWFHETGDAGVAYEYYVVGERVVETACGTLVTSSFEITSLDGLPTEGNLPSMGTGVAYAIGFRSPTAIINGNITYAGGIAVPDVKVLAERYTGNNGQSLYLDGTDYVQIENANSLDLDEQMTLLTWIKPEDLSKFSVVVEKQSSYGLHISPDGSGYFYIKNAADATEHSTPIAASSIQAGQWINLICTYDQSSRELKLYINGELKSNTVLPLTVTGIQSSIHPLTIGRQHTTESHYFQGFVDETRIYNRALTADEVLRESGRITPSDALGLVGYWKVFEGIGNYIYDAAHLGSSYYKNDGRIYGADWSDDIPSSTQLGYASYTDQNGNYSIQGVAFTGTGENFNIVPTIALGGVVHEFDPGGKTLFLGEGSRIHNEVDFTDISAFEVTGRVVYKYQNNDAGVEGTSFYIDGLPVSDGFGNVIQSDENGNFTIEVPIGKHIISVKNGLHEFEFGGVWPIDNKPYDFNQPVSGIEFRDTTTYKVAGRVVGGLREADKPIGFGKSTNNIGQAKFRLVSTNMLIDTLVTTNAGSGEYEVALPPLRYHVYKPLSNDVGIDIASNPAVDFGSLELVDITKSFVEFTEKDSVFDGGGNLTAINEYPYNEKLNFILRNAPTMSVAEGTEGLEGSEMIGERNLEYQVDENNSVVLPVITGSTYELGRPVYQMARKYGLQITMQESYLNYDVDPANPVEDLVPVTDAKLYVTNNVGPGYYQDQFGDFQNYAGKGAPDEVPLTSVDGSATYHFTADEPNLTVNASDATLSYTRNLAITAIAGGNEVTWPADPAGLKVYVMGSKGTSTNIITKAPDLVDFILRDPPGSESYSWIEQGSALTTSQSFSLATTASINMAATIGAGNNTLVGGGICGVGEIFEGEAGVTLGLDVSTSIGTEGEFQQTFEFTQNFSTRADNINVGAQGDLFVGKSENFRYGISDNLMLVTSDECNLDEVFCVDGMPTLTDGSTTYKLGRKYGFYLVPDGLPTRFIYSQNHIENYLIPDLVALRNTSLQNPKYTNVVDSSDPLYGTNNDDPRWGSAKTTDTPNSTEPGDLTGPSYTFNHASGDDVDSVRWYNQQIRLWRETLAQNEREKAEAMVAGVKDNYTFSGGASLSEEKTYAQSGEISTSLELAIGVSAGTSFGAEGYGIGIDIDLAASLEVSTSFSASVLDEKTTTYGYELNDPDVGDFMSVDVFNGANGNGPIFSIVGGQTMCPHEDAVFSKYYNPGTQLSARTLQREKPKIDVAVASVFNVPADEEAVFTLTLANESESFDDQLYTIGLVESSNPDGAVLKIDGAAFNQGREYLVPGSGAINKTLTMERGPSSYEYEDIKIYIRSLCQYDPTDNDVDIVDTVSVSAFFLPVCTDISVLNPTDNWVANSEFNNSVPIVIGDYDMNGIGFEDIRVEYKPSSASSWTLLETYFRDSTITGWDNSKLVLPISGNTVSYNWDVTEIPDGEYDIRAVSGCALAENNSNIHSGVIDRLNPHAFGSPMPSDGVLSPDDQIFVQFNEPINEGLLLPSNFDIRGVLNGGEVRHEAAVYFDGDNDVMIIPAGIDLTRKSFSIDMYVQRDVLGAQSLLSQGEVEGQSLQIGFDTENKVYFTLQGHTVTSAIAIADQNWHHLAITFDYKASDAILYVDGSDDAIDNSFNPDYTTYEPIKLGQGAGSDFSGYAHELRIWNKALSMGEVNTAAVKRMSRSTPNLISNWEMEEAQGNVAFDKVRSLHAEVSATRQVFPTGKSINFDGASYAQANSPVISNQQSFTVEFWFKSTGTDQTIISTASGELVDPNVNGWSFGLNGSGELIAKSKGEVLSYGAANNGQWHHAALSLDRFGSVIGVLDGLQVFSADASEFEGFAGSHLTLGARGWYNGSVDVVDQQFNGQLDEVRIWNTNRSLSQIERDLYNKLTGDEGGLMAYYPMEDKDAIASLESKVLAANSDDLTISGAASFTDVSPNIKQPRSTSAVPFTFSANGDKVVLKPTADAALIENVGLEITVRNIRDLHNNKLQNPITWTAYVDQNQVVWLSEGVNIEKELGVESSFTATIVNTGGAVTDYQISNLPEWLDVSEPTGSLEPLSSKQVDFTIHSGLNIGRYDQDIYLTTDFGFDERMSLSVDVVKSVPSDWVVDVSDFQYSMEIVGQLSYNGVISRNERDMIAAFVDGEIRGVATLEYVDIAGGYQSYLSVYSNKTAGEQLEFRVWNARDGRVHSNVTPMFEFVADEGHGSPLAPVTFDVPNYIHQIKSYSAGWQWVSFNLESAALSDVSEYLGGEFNEGDLIKGHQNYDQYAAGSGWFGTLSANGGLGLNKMYKLWLNQPVEATVQGNMATPESHTVTLTSGWNWVGFVSQRNMGVNTALSAFNAQVGDKIKSQNYFAVYTGAAHGWVGSLETMEPGEGYLINSNTASSFVYPEAGTVNARTEGQTDWPLQAGDLTVDPTEFADNMNVIAELAYESSDTLLAFVNGALRGMAVPIDNPVTEGKAYFLTVYGYEDGSELTFMAINNGNRVALASASKTLFRSNDLIGSVELPLKLHATDQVLELFDDQATVAIYPNPFTSKLVISGTSSGAGLLRISVADLSGRHIGVVNEDCEVNGDYQLEWDGRFSDGSEMKPGIYLMTISDGDQSGVIRIIKQ